MCNMTVIGPVDSDSEQFICHTTTKNPYTCNQNIQIHYNMCCADAEPEVGQSSNTPKGTTRPPRGVVCKI